MGLVVGFSLLVLASLSQGAMGFGQKRFQPWSWEAYWFYFSILSMVIVPVIWISLVIPEPMEAIKSVASKDGIMAAGMGALWGVGALMWAKCLVYLGVSITYGIGMSMSAIIGSLTILFKRENAWEMESTRWIILGVLVVVIGVVIVTIAGVKREKLKGTMPDVASLSKGMLLMMLVFAFANGAFSAGLPIGFDQVEQAERTALEQGAQPYNATLVKWMFVFVGGLFIQAGYALIIMIKKKTYKSYVVKGSWQAYLTGLITAILWFAPLALYGMSTSILGELGAVIGWSLYCALAVTTSNIIGVLTGEWKGVRKPLMLMWSGIVVLILSFIILGYANSL